MSPARHINNGECDKCDLLFRRYANFHPGLRLWFRSLQFQNPDAHVSCAGRGMADQEAAFRAGWSRARWKKSAHNYNVALDLFRLTQFGLAYDVPWFRDIVGKAVDKHNLDTKKEFAIKWYGAPNSKFFELPHVEVDGWPSLGTLVLVE